MLEDMIYDFKIYLFKNVTATTEHIDVHLFLFLIVLYTPQRKLI